MSCGGARALAENKIWKKPMKIQEEEKKEMAAQKNLRCVLLSLPLAFRVHLLSRKHKKQISCFLMVLNVCEPSANGWDNLDASCDASLAQRPPPTKNAAIKGAVQLICIKRIANFCFYTTDFM